MNICLKIRQYFLLYCLFGIYTSNSNSSTPIEWAMQVVESIVSRHSPSQLGLWRYQEGFYLYGQYRVWQKFKYERYFEYIQDWLDERIDNDGNIERNINNLDNMQPGLITLYCYEETGEEKYKKAADRIREEFDTYPRTSDGAFWHMKNREGELWLDGVYMALPFLMKYGEMFGGSTFCFNEASKQIILFANHLKDSTGLLYHGYDEDGSEEWADSVTYRSSEFWGRSIGWFGMAIVEILEILPESHPNRAALIEILKDLIAGLANYQDKDTGLWYQVVNKGDHSDNWLETSCSCMYTFFTARAVERGYVDSSYIEVANKGYEGILTKISIGNDGLTYIMDSCEGTEIGDYNYYINRKRTANNIRGLGAFLLASMQMSKFYKNSNKNSPPHVTIASPHNYSYFAIGSNVPIIVNAYDGDSSIKQVKFYAKDNLLFSDTREPWKYIWSDVAKGDYILTAIAYDDKNASKISLPMNIIVANDSLIYQAEKAIISEGKVDANHQGYTGTGFVNYDNKAGSYIEWIISIPTSGHWNISFRYANGSVDNRLCRIELNGGIVESGYDFESTGRWDNWIYSESLKVLFNSVHNTLRVTAITSEGGPNVDLLRISIMGKDSVRGQLLR